MSAIMARSTSATSAMAPRSASRAGSTSSGTRAASCTPRRSADPSSRREVGAPPLDTGLYGHRGDKDGMTRDYYPVLKRATAALGSQTAQARRAIYDRARSFIAAAGLSARQTGTEQAALEAAIERIEAEREG